MIVRSHKNEWGGESNEIIVRQLRQQLMIHSEEGTSFCDIKYKIVFLGDMSVGKSSIIDRFINGHFDDKQQHTVGIDFLAKNVSYNHHMYRLQLWDTAGQEKFRSLIPAYLRDAHCAVLVYDITNPISFHNIQSWISLFNDYKRPDAVMVLVGNKIDLKEDKKVSQQKSFEFASKNHLGYCQVSAKKGDGVQVLFESIIENIQVLRQGNEEEPPIDSDEYMGEQANGSDQKINKQTVVKVATLKKSSISCCTI